MKWKKILLIVSVIVAIILFFVIGKNRSDVESTSVRKGNLREELVLSGEILATNYAKLSFETSGKVVYVGVKEGDIVNKGKLISKLDTTVLNSSYQIALSNLRATDATAINVLDQVKDHSSDETFAQKDLRTTAEVNKDKAYEAVITAKRNLAGASLYAPFDGIVTYLNHPFIGVYTGLGAVEAEIIDPTTIYLSVLADQSEINKIKKDQKVKIALDSFEDMEYDGVVTNIGFTPKIGESGSVYEIKVLFENVDLTNSQFKIAMTGDAKFIISEKNNVFYVPINFINQDKTGQYLEIDKKGTKLFVETGIESEDYIEIIGEIEEGLVVYD